MNRHHADLAARVRVSYEADLGPIGAFLPARVPVDELPAPLQRFLDACAELPRRHPRQHGGVRAWLNREFPIDAPDVRRAIVGLEDAEVDTLTTALCALGHTYRWDTVPPAAERFAERSIALPAGIAGPWGMLARRTGQPRVGSAWSLHLTNWRMPGRPGGASYRPEEISPATVRMARKWLEPPFDAHLEAFSLSFVLVEAMGAKVLRAVVETIEAAAHRQVDETLVTLERLHAAITTMTLAFSANVRKRRVDPSTWLELVQPTFAWAACAEHPARIEGGPSGMQLGTIHALDAAFAIDEGSALAELARISRRHMPAAHRRFLGTVDRAGHLIHGFVVGAGSAALAERFDACLGALSSFRVTHRARGAQYLRGRPPSDIARASTGLTIGIGDDPVSTFERSMNERIAETEARMLRPGRRRECPEPYVVST